METPKLTRKQKTFVDVYVETGNGTLAAKKAYDIKENDNLTPRVIASENLTKPNIKEAIKARITPELVEQAHESLLTAVRLDYFMFPKWMEDEEIEEHVEAQGLTCISIRESDKGKMAFYALPDGSARGKGIELYHKIQGTFAPEKHLNVNVQVKEPSERLQKLAKKLNGR